MTPDYSPKVGPEVVFLDTIEEVEKFNETTGRHVMALSPNQQAIVASGVQIGLLLAMGMIDEALAVSSQVAAIPKYREDAVALGRALVKLNPMAVLTAHRDEVITQTSISEVMAIAQTYHTQLEYDTALASGEFCQRLGRHCHCAEDLCCFCQQSKQAVPL